MVVLEGDLVRKQVVYEGYLEHFINFTPKGWVHGQKHLENNDDCNCANYPKSRKDWYRNKCKNPR